MKLLLGVTGSVAAKLTPKLVAAIFKRHPGTIIINIIVTERGQYFFRREDIDLRVKIMGDKDEWPEGGYEKGAPVPHIDLGEWADKLLIAPLTADTLSDMAHGKADKFLTSIVLAWPRDKQIILAPAMNTRMWENPITRANLDYIRDIYHLHVVEPIEGNLACGVTGMGAMAKIDDIVAALSSYT
jgi:phosphopantothenoylcysteine decarboxylase